MATLANPARAQEAGSCPPAGYDRAALEGLKSIGFAIAEAPRRNSFALAIADCLGDADPMLRDGIAFEAIQTLMRGRLLAPATISSLRDKLLPRLNGPEGDGFSRPFAALVLAEVARTDRLAPWMTDADRVKLAEAAVKYVREIRDHRGYDEREGWRHGVAHGADLLLQLAVNIKTGKPELDGILDAVATQVAPAGHFYIHGEAERLAAPVLAVARRALHEQSEWDAFFKRVTDPAPLEQWADAYKTSEGLAKKHDTMAFLSVLYINVDLSSATVLKPLLPAIEAGLRALP